MSYSSILKIEEVSFIKLRFFHQFQSINLTINSITIGGKSN